jgi:Right handed beta helix region
MMISRLGIRNAVVSATLALASVPASAQVFCGAVVTQNEVMVTDILCPSDDPAVTVVGPATLDMNGHRIFGGHSNQGVLLDGKGATLKNGAVIEFRVGVHVSGSGGHTVDTVASRDNEAHGFQIDSAGNRVEHSVAYINGGIGFFVFSFRFPESRAGFANGNTLSDDVAVFSGSWGFRLGGNDGSYKRNLASENEGGGFLVEGTHNSLLHNSSHGNRGNGFEVSGTEHQLFENVSVSDYAIAFLLPEKTDKKSQLVSNVAISGDVGFQGGTTLMDNASVSNREGGISVSTAGAKITGNAVVGIDRMAIIATGGGSDVSRNRTLANDVGMVIGFSPGMTMSSNLAVGNKLDLVDLNAFCTGHAWSKNVFSTASSACIQ